MTPHHLARSGIVGLVAGLLGAASAVVLLAWPPQIADDSLMSYPFTETGFYVAQVFFAVQHGGLAVLLLGLTRSGAAGSGRVVRAGAWGAVLGMVLLTGAEVLAMRYADWDADLAGAGPMGTVYGVASAVIGLGALVAGIGVLRAGVWSGWRRWTPLGIGAGMFVMVMPGLFGGFVVGRVVLGLWMLQFAALGWSLYAESRSTVPPGVWSDDALGNLYGASPSSSVDRAAAS